MRSTEDEKLQHNSDNPDCILLKKSIKFRWPNTIADDQTYGDATASLVYSLH